MKRVLVTGASGFIGSALCPALESAGYVVVHEEVENLDAVVHLAGEPIASERWSKAKKERILNSRKEGTAALVKKLEQNPPKVFISASGIGFYGERGDELVDETMVAGEGFLAHVCVEWEKEARALEIQGVRTVQTRFGMVTGKGGALAKMVGPFKWGLGCVMGSGQQWVSWVALDDLVRAIAFIIERHEMRGPINVVAPEPVRQCDFAHLLGKVLKRPVWLTMPRWVVKILFGQMGEEVLLTSAKVAPRELLKAGFKFLYPTLESTLRRYL